MSNLHWTKYWRVVEGVVQHEDAFSYDEGDDYIFFGEDPRYESDSNFGEDAEQVHVDDIAEGNGIFENEEDAKKYAVTWLKEKIEEYQNRLAKFESSGG